MTSEVEHDILMGPGGAGGHGAAAGQPPADGAAAAEAVAAAEAAAAAARAALSSAQVREPVSDWLGAKCCCLLERMGSRSRRLTRPALRKRTCQPWIRPSLLRPLSRVVFLQQ
jgi:hypothetical protein